MGLYCQLWRTVQRKRAGLISLLKCANRNSKNQLDTSLRLQRKSLLFHALACD